jgi:DNA-binding NtrC family response regulator
LQDDALEHRKEMIKNEAGPYTGKREVPLKRELDSLVAHMHASGITYAEGVREFKKRFILEVLARHRGNQCKAARELGMHRNTLSRTIAELDMDPVQIRNGLKRPPRSERPGLDIRRTAGL